MNQDTATDLPELAPLESDGVVYTLPSWVYSSDEFFALEAESIHRCAWQFVCHVSDIPEPGDFETMNLLSERALVIRGEDGEVRAFHNVCRHRAHAVVNGLLPRRAAGSRQEHAAFALLRPAG